MLQKLLIALCTIFVLSACGGDIDLGPDRVSSTPEPEPEDPEEPPPEPGDPDESQVWFYENFDAAGEDEASPEESWMDRCMPECNASAELSLGASDGDNALSVAPEWASDEDNLEVHTSIPEIDDMTGGAASAWVHVPEAYSDDANLQMHLFFANANGATARSRAFAATTSGWNKLAIWSMEPGTGEPVEGDDSEDPEIDYGSFGWHDENFTMEDINTVGVRFSANGKPVDVGGDLLVDNVLITQGSAFAPMLLDVTEGWFTKAAWDIEGDEANDPIYGDGFVALEATNPNQQLVQPVEGPGSYGGAEVVFTVSFDQAYVDSASGFQPFGQVFNDTAEGYADDEEVGGNWSCWTGLGDVTVDEEMEVTCTMADEELFELGEDQYALFGVQSQGDEGAVAGTFRIHKVELKGLNAEEDSGEVDLQSDDWAVLDAAEGVELQRDEEGGVYFEPSAEDEKLVYLLPGPADLVGGGFTMEFTVDQAFKDSGGDIQPIIQQNFGDYAGEFGCYIGNGELTAGELHTATCTTENEAMVSEEEGNTIRVGLQVKGSVEGRVTINSMTIDD